MFMENQLTQQANSAGAGGAKGMPHYSYTDERCPTHIQNLIEL